MQLDNTENAFFNLKVLFIVWAWKLTLEDLPLIKKLLVSEKKDSVHPWAVSWFGFKNGKLLAFDI